MDSYQTSTNIWHYKPWWCQPWSILLTGLTIVLGSWFLFQRIWISAIVAIPILIWMGFFLLVYPKLMAQALNQARPNSDNNQATTSL